MILGACSVLSSEASKGGGEADAEFVIPAAQTARSDAVASVGAFGRSAVMQDDELEAGDHHAGPVAFGVRQVRRPVLDAAGNETGEEEWVAVRVEPLLLDDEVVSPPRPRIHQGSTAVGGTRDGTGRQSKTWPWTAMVTAFVGVAVVGIAFASLVLLGSSGPSNAWTPVLQDVLKTAYQALALGALGGLAKLLVDNRRQHAADVAELRDRQRATLASVAAASHQVDNARMVIRANRSVKTWTESINGPLVTAHTQLRDIGHDLTNWSEAGSPLFANSTSIRDHLQCMCDCLMSLIEEHAENKQRLSESQRSAENSPNRLASLQTVWEELMSLDHLHDFVEMGSHHAVKGNGLYVSYREHYFATLRTMRSSLTARTTAR